VSVAPEPVLQALLDAAVAGTGDTDGWLLALQDDALKVVAASGPSAAMALGASVGADAGTAGFVVKSGQPIALAPRPGDPALTSGMAAIVGREPSSVLGIPCESEEGVVGALEVIDKAGGGTFTFDDVELATLLAGVAGVALQAMTSHPHVPGPVELAGELRRLAQNDPRRYATVASVLNALIADG
jgi:GAF domain-containing protein